MRKVWITVTKDLEEKYIDEEKNLQFVDQYLEELNEENSNKTQDHNLKDILKKLMKAQNGDEEKNL